MGLLLDLLHALGVAAGRRSSPRPCPSADQGTAAAHKDAAATGSSPGIRRLTAISGLSTREIYALFPRALGETCALVACLPGMESFAASMMTIDREAKRLFQKLRRLGPEVEMPLAAK